MIKYLKRISENKYFKFFTNLYVITSLLFLFWMIFMDTNSLIFHKELNNEIRDLTEQRNKLKIEIEKDKNLIKDLNDIDNYEKFARENFYMKKDDEEIYIIEYKDTIKN